MPSSNPSYHEEEVNFGTSSRQESAPQSFFRSTSFVSVLSAASSFDLDLDIANNYNQGCALIKGRESHTSDLDTFDRFVNLMRNDRKKMIEQENQMDTHICSNSCTHCNSNSYPCSFNDDNDERLIENRTKPFNEEFWSYVREILSNAIPTGFAGVDDANTVISKSPEDSNALIEKIVSIGALNPISPSLLAEQSNDKFTEYEILTELLYGVLNRVVRMQFAAECERCGAPFSGEDKLEDIPASSRCGGCHHMNNINSMDHIMVLFYFIPEILYILADNFPCKPSKKSLEKTLVFAAVPATYSGSGFRYSVGTGSEGKHKEICGALLPGRYRMHCPVSKTDNYLEVKREAKTEDEPYILRLPISSIVCKFNEKQSSDENKANYHTLVAPHGKIHFDVFCDTCSFFLLWVQEDLDDDTLLFLPHDERVKFTPVTFLLHNHVFSKFFSKQIVSSNPDATLAIQNIVIVFTDIVNSTNIYASLGDGAALQIVRQHFYVLFSAFTKRGRVVKTIGDSVMASFTSGRAAIEAVAEALRKIPHMCKLPNGDPLQIRVGVHCGSTIVVPVNGCNDFFGQTVNIAARVEQAAKASECFITEDVLEFGPDSRSAFNEIVNYRKGDINIFEPTQRTELSLKGVERLVYAQGFRLRDRPKRRSTLVCDSESIRNMRRSFKFTRRASLNSSITSPDPTTQSFSSSLDSEPRNGRRFSSHLHDVDEESKDISDVESLTNDNCDDENYIDGDILGLEKLGLNNDCIDNAK